MTGDHDLVDAVLARDPEACRAFITRLTPVIRHRVARVLAAHAARRGRPVERHEVLDLIQEIFVLLLDRDGRVLRSWEPSRGLSLANFVGLVAEREAGAFLRSGRRSGWAEAPTDDAFLASSVGGDVDSERQLGARQLLERLVERLRERLSPRGFALFHALYVQEQDVEAIAADFAMSPNALYTFRTRLRREVAAIRSELAPSSLHTGEIA
ncbi:MAG: sigma-70 family RNA polymerase sigma factor [Myxococcales bacterium]|nr:sigma-70 family RNA polymerase sigma factor [Myxococcales bacterium]